MMKMHREELMELAAEQHPHSLSLYLPYGIHGQDNLALSIHRKNMLREAKDYVEKQVSEAERKVYLQHLHRLEQDASLATGHYGTRLVVINAQGMRSFDLPWRLKPLLKAQERVYLTPFLRFFTAKDSFYMLRLHLNDVALYYCDGSGFEKVKMTVPMRIAEEYGSDTDQWSLGHFNEVRDRAALGRRPIEFTGMPGGSIGQMAGSRSGGIGASRMGYGGENTQVKWAEVDYFLRHLDEALCETVHDRTVPLMCACTEKTFERFQAVTRYQGLLPEHLSGDQYRDVRELYDDALQLIRDAGQRALGKEQGRYKDLVNTGKTADDPEVLQRAAGSGLVEVLFVRDPLMEMNGATPEHSRDYTRIAGNGLNAESEDFIERTAVETWAHGGQLYWVPPEKMPKGQLAAAVLRAPIGGALT